MDTSVIDGNETAILMQVVADAKITNYVTVASLTWLLYDYIISFQEEVELIWKGNQWKSLLKLFYIWNRYFCTISISVLAALRMTAEPSATYCRASFLLEGTIYMTIIATVDGVLIMRVWILYDRDRRLLMFLIPLIIVEVAIMLLVELLLIPKTTGSIYIGPAVTGCFPLTVSRYLVFYAVPSLIVAFIMFSMTLYKCLRSLRMGMTGRLPIITLFLRDGVFWFLGVFVGIGATAFNWSIGRPTLVGLTSMPSVTIFSIIASHALLNIKKILTADVVGGAIISHYDSAYFERRSIVFGPLGHFTNLELESNDSQR